MTGQRFRMGRLDHVHVRVPDRGEAAAWYAEHLGFEPVERLRFWADAFDGGPLQISADGGTTTLALFEASDDHPMIPNVTGIAFSVDAEQFVRFSRALPGSLNAPDGTPLQRNDLVDFDLCWAYEIADPWGNRLELNCDEYERIRDELVRGDGLSPQRYWPAELIVQWRAGGAAKQSGARPQE